MTAEMLTLLVMENHGISCRLPTRGIRLLDMLSDPHSDFLQVHDVSVVTPENPELVEKLGDAVVRKADITMAIVPSQVHEAPERRRFARIVKSVTHAVVLAGNCEVRGSYHAQSSTDPLKLLTGESSRFFPLTDASITWGRMKQISAPVVLINRGMVSLVSISG